jgi:excisionase family DNA binding protein
MSASAEMSVGSPSRPTGYSPKQVAERFGLSLATIYNLMAARELAFVKIGRRRIIPTAEVERFRRTSVSAARARKRRDGPAVFSATHAGRSVERDERAIRNWGITTDREGAREDEQLHLGAQREKQHAQYQVMRRRGGRAWIW